MTLPETLKLKIGREDAGYEFLSKENFIFERVHELHLDSYIEPDELKRIIKLTENVRRIKSHEEDKIWFVC